MYTDIQKIVIHAVHMRRWLDELADIPNGQPYVDPMQRIAVAVKTIKPIFDRMALERIAMLPPKVGVELAQSVGGFPFLCDAIDSTIYELGILTRPLDERRVDLRDHALILSNPLNGIVCFLEWFGSEFPDDRESGPDEAIKLIKAGSANRTTQ
ncbi:hypothetical protein GCM10007862_17790 [Dyella lipolytica]|nr:hypothetical protein GCM10007862_17790 [Dyella lipolytica]